MKFLLDRPFILDGAMGTELQARGMKPGETPETWNLTRPDDIRAVHESYLAAGSDAVYANTFGANPAKYHAGEPLEDVISAGVTIAKEAAARFSTPDKPRFVALDVGPTGRLLKPAGDCSFDEACDAFAFQIAAGAKAGADFIAIETMGDTMELKAAVVAAKENSSLPVIATVALGEDGKLLTGADPEAVAALLEGLRVDAIGFNCGLGPDLLLPFLERLARATSLPLVVKPNAGMPKMDGGRTVFTVDPASFAGDVQRLVEAGASVVGGCCGTTPAHIKAIADISSVPPPRVRNGLCAVSSGTHAVEISLSDTVVIGERINPTGKKRLKTALAEGDVAYILREAVCQAEAGAAILDVNTGVPGLDEPAVLQRTVEAVQSVTDLPLQIDTSDPVALERAMRHCNGKPLVNSVNGKKESMDAVFPVVAKYGGVIVALTLDENGIPPDADGRLAIARKILERGAEFGFGPDDFVFDALSMAVSAAPDSANVALESLRRIRSELGCRTILGVSNISFGLPARPGLNAAFYTLAMGAGLSAAIINPLSPEMMSAYRAFRALTARDVSCAEWIANASSVPSSAPSAPPAKVPQTSSATSSASGDPLFSAIRRGLKSDAASAAREALSIAADPVSVIDASIVPALEEVGKGFEEKRVFLPQLLMSADAAGAAFDVIRAALAKSGSAAAPKGPVIVATVKGDIHDIGKNIVRALLENYGFRVIDLGRDVEPSLILETARRENCRLVGLSALMTTTVVAMEETVKLLHSELPGCRVMVGGAVLTAEYAAQIGADFYSKDAMGAVRTAESVFA
ncbi:MAG: homocysteine S-methyltransferase family protein [Kiritimatiellae bacterium]|nr:homocysteine S-methyltransferase family protein [Kiritimatiellia bacterium]